jgi:hypothetical protein
MNARITKPMTLLALALSLTLALGTTLYANQADMERLAKDEVTSEFDRDNCSYDPVKDLYLCRL